MNSPVDPSRDVPALQVRLLGAVEAWLAEERLDIVAPQSLIVLAMLAADPGRTVSTTRLAEGVWGDRQPASAIGALRNQILMLRRRFDAHGGPGAGARWLCSARGGYRLDVSVDSDAARVEELVEDAESACRDGKFAAAEVKLSAAQALWRGDPLVGLTGPWAEQERTRLRRLRTTLRGAALSVALEVGDHAAAIAELEALIVAEPHTERWRELLMIALSRSGRRIEALEVYRDTRRLLADDLGLEPGPDLVRLHQQLLSAELPGEQAERSDGAGTGWVAADLGPRLATPAQLPPDPPDFVGRAGLLDELSAALSAVPLRQPVVVTGMGGIGKTTLAVHLAHRVRHLFPDGQFYLDLGGTAERPRTAEELLAMMLCAIGVERADVPPDPQERTALWRTVIAGRRVLLVLDDARDADQVVRLLPGTAEAAVLITGRSTMAELFGARMVRLDVLSPDESRELLRTIVSERRVAAEPEAARDILAACGHLPVAVRVVGARLAGRPGWALAPVAARLADERRRLTELAVGGTTVESVFRYSYRQLDAELARAFVIVAVPDAPDLSLGAIAALLERDRAEAERLCETLVDLGMLQSPQLGRYRYHDLLRLFARTLFAEVDLEPAPVLERLAEFCLATMKNIVDLRDSGVGRQHFAETAVPGERFTDERECAAWVAGERFGLVALYRQAATGANARTVTLAIDLALLLAVSGDGGEHLPQVAQAMDDLSAVAARGGDRRAMARAQVAAATARLVGAGDMRVTVPLGNAAAVLRELGDRAAAITAEQMMGTAAAYQGLVDVAVEHYRRAMGLVQPESGRWAQGMGWATIARAYCDAGRADDAEAAAERALAIAREVGSLRLESMALQELGFAHSLRQENPAALELCVEALRVARRAGRRHQEGWALSRLAEVLLRCGDAQAAVPVAAEAVQALTEVSAIVRRVRAMQVYGWALTAAGRRGEGEPVLQRARTAGRRIGLPILDLTPPEFRPTARPTLRLFSGGQHG
ncbi:AfsR/SARP family transcriptional regulator [Nocardia terpenica]|uniref:AfsR/SARP family transcriptional regulator n=1 Tax=Nocardia terpenica TaxID=455432 RepID=UPI0012FE7A49|nr:BTAD domain-containing putative transcriptional regulator [Nocardia terpenica]